MALPLPVAYPVAVTNTPYHVLPDNCFSSERYSARQSWFLLQLVYRSTSLSDTTSGLILATHCISRFGSKTPSVPTPPWWVFHVITRSVEVVGVGVGVGDTVDEAPYV